MVDHRRAGLSSRHAERAKALRRPEGAGHNLPLPLTKLIGREADRAAVADLVSRCRLVTVVGPGGVGKTRLALAVASQKAVAHRDGAWLSDLVNVSNGAGLWGTVSAALQVEPAGVGDLAPRVIAHLRSRQLLLWLDNCEHLVSECAELASSVACVCPGVSLLLTSRQPLGVVGERVWPLAGLGADIGGDGGRLTSATAPAVDLFVERAVARRPDFSLPPNEAPVVAELCRRLDGVPSAIELAAARVGVFSPKEILARLDDPFAFLIGGGPATPARHRSLAATIGWSHDLLSTAEAVLFRRLAIFAGGFTSPAAEAVCGWPPLVDVSVFDVLASLVDKSLVVAETVGENTRYRLFETTREYAARRLSAAEETEGMRERHAVWFMALAQEAVPHVRSPLPGPWLARLAADHDNVQAALEWTVEAERTDWALGMTSAMAAFWGHLGLFGTGRRWLVEALALPGQSPGGRLDALLGLGYLIRESGDASAAVAPLEEALKLAEDCEDAGAEAAVLHVLGSLRLTAGLSTTALPALERSSEKARAVGDRATLLQSLASAGWAAAFAGDVRLAEARFSQCLSAAERGDDGRDASWPAMVGMGWAALVKGRYDEAEASLMKAMETADRAGPEQAQAVVWCHLGQLARVRGDYGRAEALLAKALSQARETANAFLVAMRLAFLGEVAHDQGHLVAAEAALVEAVAVAGAAEVTFAHARCLVALGGLRVTQRREPAAARILDEGWSIASTNRFGGVMSTALVEQARLRRLGGDLQEAARAVTRAIRDGPGDLSELVGALEVLGGIRASQGRRRIACRLFGAASAARKSAGIVRPPSRLMDYERDVVLARSGLTPDQWDALWAAGESLPAAAAAALAVKCPGRRDSARTGWAAITPTERQVLALVAQGLTNREAAARLVVSPRTVETHVANVLAKVGIASRRQLARVAAARGLDSSVGTRDLDDRSASTAAAPQ